MRQIIFVLVAICYAVTVSADAGGTLGDIDLDNKIGLKEAVYALQIAAGKRISERTVNSFDVYRNDIIRELNRLADNEDEYFVEYDTFTDDLSVIRLNSVLLPGSGSFVWPDMSFEIIYADSRSYAIRGSHSSINGYSWTYSATYSEGRWESDFRQNNEIHNPGMEIFELYSGEVMKWLKSAFRYQINYKAEYDTYSDDISYTTGLRKWNPDIILRVVSSDRDHFLIEGEHSEIRGYSWSVDSDGQIKTILKESVKKSF